MGSVWGKCPHCGAKVRVGGELTVYHDWPRLTRQVCPGSRQIPRSEHDHRPLWSELADNTGRNDAE